MLKIGSLFLILSAICMNVQAAENTAVLPKNIYRARLVNIVTSNIQDTYNQGGNLQGLSQDFNLSIDTKTLAAANPALKGLYNALNSVEEGLGDQLLSAQLYSETQLQVDSALAALEYGVNERVTLGIRIPVVRRELTTSLRAESVNNAGEISRKLGSKLSPAVAAGLKSVQNTTFDGDFFTDAYLVQRGYKAPEDFRKTELGDIEIGAKHKFYTSNKRAMTYQIGLRVPSGTTGEIDDVFDSGSGGGAWGLGLLFFHDYYVTKRLTFGGMLKSVYLLPDTRKRAVPRNEDDFLPSLLDEDGQVQDVTRRQALDFESEISATYAFPNGEWEVWGAYQYNQSGKDKFEGPNQDSLYYQGLSDGTDFSELNGEVGVSYSTIPAFRAKRFFAPLQIDALVNSRLRGTNTSKRTYVRIDAKVFF